MGWDSTRKLRFYPINGNLESIDIDSIVAGISNSVHSLCDEIVYAENQLDGCYDLKFNSSKLSGAVNFNKATTVVWDLLSYENGSTLLGNISNMIEFDNAYYEVALFAFDEIRIRGDQNKLTSFFKKFFPTAKYLMERNLMKRADVETIVKLNYFYTANNQHDTGNEKRRLKTKKTSSLIMQEEFRASTVVNSIFEDIIPQTSNWFKLKELLAQLQKFEYENPFEGLEGISFLYKNQIVKKIDWYAWKNQYTNQQGTRWKYSSADGWDNCINPKWREFVNA